MPHREKGTRFHKSDEVWHCNTPYHLLDFPLTNFSCLLQLKVIIFYIIVGNNNNGRQKCNNYYNPLQKKYFQFFIAGK